MNLLKAASFPSIVAVALIHFLNPGLCQTQIQTCYWPNGAIPTDSTLKPCNSAGDSHCCGSEDSCLSTGLCFAPGTGMIYRGGCTQKAWNTSSCPQQYCQAELSSSIAQLWQCPTTNRTFPTLTPHINWWCGDETINTPCALPGSQGGNGTFVTYPTSAVFIEESTPSSTISTAPSSTSVISSISSPPSTPSAVLIIAATTTTQIPSSSSSNTTATTGGFVASQIPIAIGTGIGVPFGVLALGTLFFRVRSWMRSKQAQREDSAEFGMSGALGIVGVAGAGGGLPGIEEGDAEGGRALGLSDLSGFGKGGERSEGSGSGSGI